MRHGRVMMGAPGVFLVLALVGVHAPAQAGCSGADVDFTAGSSRVATVRDGAGRTYFVQDADAGQAPGCPNATAACRARAYVVPGDVVLLAQAQGDYICGAVINAQGFNTVGWLPSAALAPAPERTPGGDDWIGHWMQLESDIVVTRGKSGELAFKGQATWGGSDPERVRRGAVNTGEFSAEARPDNGTVAFTVGDDRTLPYEAGDETDCRVRMARRGPYLVVRDNTMCGGMNVSFSGSHIKPWRECTRAEKLDANNGLPLIASLDALFDCHMITFGVDQSIIVSHMTPSKDRRTLGLLGRLRVPPGAEREVYLRLHRARFDEAERKRAAS